MSAVILGYTKEGKPIHPCEPGRIYTAAFVMCAGCQSPIRSMGGPIHGAVCLKCWENK